MKHLISIFSLALLTACSNQSAPETATETAKVEAPKMDHAKIVTGNGENNFIILDGASRDGSSFTFPEVTLDKDGFLVMHPFKDGVPVQTVYVGATPLKGGTHNDVNITIDRPAKTGDNFIVMLHYDMNEDGIFDFGDGVTVPDAPVFEGHTLVALRYTAP